MPGAPLSRVTTALLAAAAITAATAAPARASAFCEVLDTPDGYVVLREAPAAGAPLVARMQAGDEVMLLSEKSGAFERVRYWPAGVRLEDGGFDRHEVGWVDGRLIDLCG